MIVSITRAEFFSIVPVNYLYCSALSVLHAFFDSQFTSVVAAFGAYMVIHNGCAAVAAGRELSGFHFVVSSSFCCSGL